MHKLLIFLTFITLIFAQDPIVSVDIPDSQIKSILAYWTPERMANAKPYRQWNFNNKTIPYPKGSITEFVPSGDYKKEPYKAVGKVYFTEGRSNYVCSGSVVGNNAILTAGHCVSNGQGTYHKNWIFKPAYQAGRQGPAGSWIAKKLITFEKWHRYEYIEKDVGFAIVNRNNDGKTVHNAVGYALSLKLNTAKGENVIAIGYPVPRFGGERMVRTKADVIKTEKQFKPPTIGIISRMEGGCSGGPWVCNQQFACGLNSYGYAGRGDLYSPGFDEEVKTLFEYALKQE